MKKGIIAATALIMALSANAQKICYVDMDYVMNKLPNYIEAQKQLEIASTGFQKEVDAKRTNVENLYKTFQAEQVLMPEQLKQQKIKEIEAAEKEVKELQRAKFGPGGDLFKKRTDLIKPIQDKVYEEVQKLAQKGAYDFILDKSSGPSLLFANDFAASIVPSGSPFRSLSLVICNW